MNLQAIKYVYFLGAGGIGMSALARYFLQRGIAVGGYDKTQTALTNELQHEGMNICFSDSIQSLPAHLIDSQEKESSLIIYTPAIPADRSDRNWHVLAEWAPSRACDPNCPHGNARMRSSTAPAFD